MDCDPGVDDAIALAYAAAHPEAFELLAVTSVTGNQTIDKVTRNALDLVSLYRLSIPVARGAETPLLRDPQISGGCSRGKCSLFYEKAYFRAS